MANLMEETQYMRVNGSYSRTLHGLANGFAYYNYEGNHFRVFSSFESGKKWLDCREDYLVMQDCDTDEELDKILLILQFKAELEKADAIRLSDSPILTSWDLSSDYDLISTNWQDNDFTYEYELSEDNIVSITYDENSTYSIKKENNCERIELLKISPVDGGAKC